MVRTLLLVVSAFLVGLWVGSVWLGDDAGERGVPVADSASGESRSAAQHVQSGEAVVESATDTDRGDGPRLAPARSDARSGSLTLGARQSWTLALVDDGFAEYRRQPTARVPDDLREATAAGALRYMRDVMHGYGGWMTSYVDKRSAVGTLADPPRITMQARGSGRVGSYTGASSSWRGKLSATQLDLVAPPPVDPRIFEAFVESGVPPLDRVLLLETIDVVYHLGDEETDTRVPQWRKRGNLEIRVSGSTALEVDNEHVRDRRGSLVGLKVLKPPYSLPEISIRLRTGVVGLVAHGRYVSWDEASDLRDKRFRWVQVGDDGLLSDDLVTLQVLADHGGGNDRKVRLDGSTYRIDSVLDVELWDPALDLRKNNDSFAWHENTGVVPDGKVYRITRIDWRARLDPDKSGHSDFVIRFGSKKLVECKAPDGIEASGSWRGEIDVRRDDEDDFEVVCSYYGMGEAVVYGTLVAPE